MAESFTSLPGISTFTTMQSDRLKRIDFPNLTRSVRLVFTTNDGKVATAGSDGSGIGVLPFFSVPADTEWTMIVDQDSRAAGKGPASIYVTSATGGTAVTMMCESV